MGNKIKGNNKFMRRNRSNVVREKEIMSKTNTLVREIMHEGVVTMRGDDTLGDIAATLSDAEVSALVITNDEGVAIGVISQIDLVSLYFDKKCLTRKARDVMTEGVIDIQPNASVEEGAVRMAKRNIHRLFVLDEKRRPIGVLSVTDVVRDMRDTYQEERL
jgi:CBS domain-containing protein